MKLTELRAKVKAHDDRLTVFRRGGVTYIRRESSARHYQLHLSSVQASMKALGIPGTVEKKNGRRGLYGTTYIEVTVDDGANSG